MKQFNIAINGQRAVDVARAFIGNYCYRGIFLHGKKIAQMEITVDWDGEYNGNPNKWVDVCIMQQKNVEIVLNQLARLEFTGLPCIIQEENLVGCVATAKDLCCLII